VLPALAVLLLALRPLWLGIALTTLTFVVWDGALVGALLHPQPPDAIGDGDGNRRGRGNSEAQPVALCEGDVERFASETETLRRFQAPGLLALLAKDPQLLAKPVRQQAAILFVDLSGFTGLTEALGPAWTRDLLVELHELIERAATDHHGFVVSYMGDGAMIVFGLPAPQPGDAASAFAAVKRLHRDLTAWIGNLPPVAVGKLWPRVGGHFGQVILSRLGAADHQHIAATGDTVNVASRLLEVSKQNNAPIAVSEDLYRAAGLPGIAAEQGLGEVMEIDIRGRAHSLSVRLGDARRA
jgi:adenylate cyclase